MPDLFCSSLNHDYTHDANGNVLTEYLYLSDLPLGKDRPPHKTLFGAPRNKGLPIGNLNSQFFANVYLNGLDQFVKHQLRCRYYLRYCDDFVLLSRDREELSRWRDRIETYLRENLLLELNSKREKLRPVSNGIDFLGYIVRRDYLLVRRRVVNNLRSKLKDSEKLLVREGRFVKRYLYDETILNQLFATLSSYLGHFKMANSYNLCRSLWEDYSFLAQYFDIDVGAKRLIRRYKHPEGIKRTYQQYLYYRWRFSGDVLFFQVGRFFEFYHARDSGIAMFLGLSTISGKNSRGARYGFPTSLMGRYLIQLLREKVPVTVILERDGRCANIKERRPVYRYECL